MSKPATQTTLFEAPADDLSSVPESPDLDSYDYYVVAFSGGKDSLACILTLLERGVPAASIELWHHDVDGREGSDLMDWPVTADYCRQVAEHFGMKIRFSWKRGGFEGEMLREDALTQPIMYEDGDGGVQQTGGTSGTPSTRRKFPQVSADLSVRWCSAYLKIDVAAAALRNDLRFRGTPEQPVRTLFVTGERAEESAARSRYAALEPHKADLRGGKRYARHIDHWRPVHRWSEAEVWEIIERWGINPHPAYHLGFGRVSCMTCIFGSADQFATVREIAPERFDRVAAYEAEFGTTIKRDMALPVLADQGTPYQEATPENAAPALAETYHQPITLRDWQLPAGAFGESCGPT